MNSVQLIGRLTADPELRYSQGQMAVSRFTLAVGRLKREDGADFIRCTCFGKTAENVDRYLAKGRQAAVIGRIQTGSYEKDGRKVFTTDVIADRVEFLGGGNEGGERTRREEYEPDAPSMPTAFEAVDENIPF